MAELLVLSAQCLIEKSVNSCRLLNEYEGITLAQRIWLALLATRRDTFIIPTANCLGYIKMIRSDAGVDPNRDFPYSRKDNRCFLSTTARIFQALMAQTIVQTVVTFHGGMIALGYEWGSRNHMKPVDKSPDEFAHRETAMLMKELSGSFKNVKAYPGIVITYQN